MASYRFLYGQAHFEACTCRGEEVVEAAPALDAALSATSASPLEPPGAKGGSDAALMTSEQLRAQARPPNLACMHLLVAAICFFPPASAKIVHSRARAHRWD